METEAELPLVFLAPGADCLPELVAYLQSARVRERAEPSRVERIRYSNAIPHHVVIFFGLVDSTKHLAAC